jgi:anti-anti-sigma factor
MDTMMAGPQRGTDDDFEVAVQVDRNAIRLSLSGELDCYTARVLEQKLYWAESQGANPIVMDLSRLEFLDCFGLAVLRSAKQRAAQRCMPLIIASARPNVRRFFQLAGLERILASASTTPPSLMTPGLSEAAVEN